MKNHADVYVSLQGRRWDLAKLDPPERQLVEELRRRSQTHADWNDFDNFWMATVVTFYESRGLTRKQTIRSAGFRIAQDLSSRLAISLGLVRESTYRDELEDIIFDRFKSRREFCEATGISEDMLSHVLAGRKHLAIDTLTEALKRIGYTIRLVPNQPAAPPKSKSKSRAS